MVSLEWDLGRITSATISIPRWHPWLRPMIESRPGYFRSAPPSEHLSSQSISYESLVQRLNEGIPSQAHVFDTSTVIAISSPNTLTPVLSSCFAIIPSLPSCEDSVSDCYWDRLMPNVQLESDVILYLRLLSYPCVISLKG